MLSDRVRQALGEDLATRYEAAFRDACEALDNVPESSGAYFMLEQVYEQDLGRHSDAVIREALGHPPPGLEWTWWPATRGDGSSVYWASALYRPARLSTPEDAARFLLADEHSLLAMWSVSHAWRALDLASGVNAELDAGRLVPSTACARALLEGSAAFRVEGTELINLWLDFKGLGTPTHDNLLNFRSASLAVLAQPLFGSRIGERSGREGIRRKNVLTLLEKFIKASDDDDDLWAVYEMLCDAVHPNFGSHTAYWTRAGFGRHNLWMAWEATRDFTSGGHTTNSPSAPVAQAVAVATAVSLATIATTWVDMVWLINDFGIATGARAASVAPYWGNSDPLVADTWCPCGSGDSVRDCTHKWGTRGAPPSAAH